MIYILQAVKNLKTFASFKQAHDTFEISGAERPQTQLQPPGKTGLLCLSSLFFSAQSSARSPGRELRSGQEWLAVAGGSGRSLILLTKRRLTKSRLFVSHHHKKRTLILAKRAKLTNSSSELFVKPDEKPKVDE